MASPNISEKSNYLNREENITKGNLSAKRVVLLSYDSGTDSLIYGTSSPVLTERYDYSDSTTIYVGSATPGTSESSTGWTIYKYDLASSSAASGKVSTSTTWTNRTSGSYA